MTPQAIAQYRLYQQQIAKTQFKEPSQVVSWLGALQAQDYAGAKWSIGLRLPDATDPDIEQAIADKAIIRTWPMRGTLHFVAPEDVHWMQALLTPRVIANSARRHEQLALDEAIFARGKSLFAKALQGGKQLTRQEMMDVLEQAGISTGNQRGYHILGWVAQTSFICFGPMRGKQPTFVLLDEWVPEGKNLTRDESLAELANRYFTGHGPATLQDFMWWSGLVAADARASLEMVKSQLVYEDVDGRTYWMSPNIPTVKRDSAAAYLLSGFDEYLLGYKDRSASLEAQYTHYIWPGGGMFSPTIVIDGRVVGTWKRTFKKDTIVMAISPFTSLSEAQNRAIRAAVKHYSKFVGMSTIEVI